MASSLKSREASLKAATGDQLLFPDQTSGDADKPEDKTRSLECSPNKASVGGDHVSATDLIPTQTHESGLALEEIPVRGTGSSESHLLPGNSHVATGNEKGPIVEESLSINEHNFSKLNASQETGAENAGEKSLDQYVQVFGRMDQKNSFTTANLIHENNELTDTTEQIVSKLDKKVSGIADNTKLELEIDSNDSNFNKLSTGISNEEGALDIALINSIKSEDEFLDASDQLNFADNDYYYGQNKVISNNTLTTIQQNEPETTNRQQLDDSMPKSVGANINNRTPPDENFETISGNNDVNINKGQVLGNQTSVVTPNANETANKLAVENLRMQKVSKEKSNASEQPSTNIQGNMDDTHVKLTDDNLVSTAEVILNDNGVEQPTTIVKAMEDFKGDGKEIDPISGVSKKSLVAKSGNASEINISENHPLVPGEQTGYIEEQLANSVATKVISSTCHDGSTSVDIRLASEASVSNHSQHVELSYDHSLDQGSRPATLDGKTNQSVTGKSDGKRQLDGESVKADAGHQSAGAPGVKNTVSKPQRDTSYSPRQIGGNLEEMMKYYKDMKIPPVVRDAVDYLKLYEANEDSFCKQPAVMTGMEEAIADATEKYNADVMVHFSEYGGRDRACFVAATTLMRFITQLQPNSLVPCSCMIDFYQTYDGSPPKQDAVKKLASIIEGLPTANQAVLEYIMEMLYSTYHKWPVPNVQRLPALAMLLSPAIFRPEKALAKLTNQSNEALAGAIVYMIWFYPQVFARLGQRRASRFANPRQIGATLEGIMTYYKGWAIPPLVEDIVVFMRQHGGIDYMFAKLPSNMSGLSEIVTEVRRKYNRGEKVVLESYGTVSRCCYVAAALLKKFLQELEPDSLIRCDKLDIFCYLYDKEMPAEVLRSELQQVIANLPTINFLILERIMYMFYKGCMGKGTGMGPSRLAAVFAPTLVRPPMEESSTSRECGKCRLRAVMKAICFLVEDYPSFFPHLLKARLPLDTQATAAQ